MIISKVKSFLFDEVVVNVINPYLDIIKSCSIINDVYEFMSL